VCWVIRLKSKPPPRTRLPYGNAAPAPHPPRAGGGERAGRGVVVYMIYNFYSLSKYPLPYTAFPHCCYDKVELTLIKDVFPPLWRRSIKELITNKSKFNTYSIPP
jgi:hypothetical protein